MKNNFIGKWVLVAEDAVYDQGKPPKSAKYMIGEGNNEGLNIFIEWVDHEDQEFSVSYYILPDGQKKANDNKAIADEIMSEFKSATQLDSYTYKGNRVIAYTSRIIDDQGKMEVIQRFFDSQGKSFENVQYYLKE